MSQSRLQSVVQQYRARLLQREAKASASLEHAYMQTLNALQPQLEALYRQIQAKLDAGEQVPLSFLYEQNRLQATKRLIEQNINHFAAIAKLEAGQLQHYGVQLGTQSAQTLLQSTVPAGVRYTFGVPSQKAIADLVGVTQAGSPLSDLFNGFGQEASDAAAKALIAGVSLGYNPHQIASSVQQALGISRNRALTICRTEALRCYRSSSIATMQANSDVCASWRWTCDKSSRTCIACIAMDGTLHDISEDFGSHPNCPCVPTPVTKSWSDILGGLGVDTSNIPDSQLDIQSGSDWFDNQDEATQRSILGNAAYQLYASGDVSDISDFVGVSHDKTWGSSIFVRPAREMKKS